MPGLKQALDSQRTDSFENSYENTLSEALEAERQAGQANVPDLADFSDQSFRSYG